MYIEKRGERARAFGTPPREDECSLFCRRDIRATVYSMYRTISSSFGLSFLLLFDSTSMVIVLSFTTFIYMKEKKIYMR